MLNELLFIVIMESVALYSIKLYSIGKSSKLWLCLSILLYGLIPIALLSALKNNVGISLINSSWNILSTVYGLIIGILIFSEVASGLELLGIATGLISLMLIGLARIKK